MHPIIRRGTLYLKIYTYTHKYIHTYVCVYVYVYKCSVITYDQTEQKPLVFCTSNLICCRSQPARVTPTGHCRLCSAIESSEHSAHTCLRCAHTAIQVLFFTLSFQIHKESFTPWFLQSFSNYCHQLKTWSKNLRGSETCYFKQIPQFNIVI